MKILLILDEEEGDAGLGRLRDVRRWSNAPFGPNIMETLGTRLQTSSR